jgi:hypothetical protein
MGVTKTKQGIRVRELRLKVDRLLQKRNRVGHIIFGHPVVCGNRLQVMIPGI